MNNNDFFEIICLGCGNSDKLPYNGTNIRTNIELEEVREVKIHKNEVIESIIGCKFCPSKRLVEKI